MQPTEIARPIGLATRMQDHMVRALDMRDRIDLHEAEPIDHVADAVTTGIIVPPEGPAGRAIKSLEVKHGTSGRPPTEMNDGSARVARRATGHRAKPSTDQVAEARLKGRCTTGPDPNYR